MPKMLLEPLECRRHLAAAQAYDWRNVTIKASGFINGIVFSPTQPNLVYINTDMGGAYRWDQSIARWTPLDDWIQSPDWSVNYNGAETIAVDPTDANRVYMGLGTYMGSSAILRSTDQGRTWLRTNVSFPMNGNGPGRNGGQRMMVDPNSPNVLYYGTRNAGIFKSTDYGATWNKLSGFTFTTDPSGVTQDVGVQWMLIDKSSATAGTPSPVVYAGVATTGANKIYRSLDAGATWNAMAGGQPTAANLFPIRAALTPNGGTLYLTYSNDDVGPNNATNGAVYKVTSPSAASPAWTQLTIDSPHGQGGWSGITIDPSNPNTLYVSTLDRWWPAPFDNIYRSTNAGASWTPLNPNNFKDDSSSGWSSTVGLHWVGDVEVDPFNSSHIMFTTGLGLYQTTNGGSATPTWSFFNDGFEQSAVTELASPNTGSVNLLSSIGDRDGFRHVDFNVSPPRLGQSQGLATGTNRDIDVAWNDANYVVRLTEASPWVQYSNDNGVSWNWMPSAGVSGAGGDGNLAISADGAKIVYEPGGAGQAIYATRSGSTWSAWSIPATNQPADGAKIIADLAAAQTFYAYQGSTVWRSTDGGANWGVMTTTAPTGAMWIRAVQGNAGHLLMTCGGNGLWRSINGGTTWTRINSAAVTTANEVGVGAAAPGQSYPAMFIGGTVSGQNGFFRSDDQGANWTMVSDTSHQYGDVIVIQADPRVYGRLYVGTNGRGILYADIHQQATALPAGWATQDVGSVGSIGSAGATAVGGDAWEVIGGGSGIAAGGTNDSFRFAYTQLSGDGAITARVMGVPLASPANNNAKAGVMIRDGLATNSRSAFVALTPGSASGVMFQSRATLGGNTSSASATVGVWPPYWVRLVRVGNTFTAYRSPDGVTWTQLGTPQTIAMGGTVQFGLATTSSDNSQVAIGKFENVSVVAAPNATITPVSPDPHGTAVSSITFQFDQPVSGFDLADLQLTRAATAVSLAGATLNSTDGGRTWTLAGLSPMTGRVGNYTITIADNSVANSAGVPLQSSASDTWIMNLLAGTSGNEQMKLVATTGTSTDYFRDGVYQYSFNPAGLGTAPLLIDGGGGTDAFVLDGVRVTLAATQKLSSLSLDHGATIDVRDHDIIIDYASGSASPIGAWNGSTYTGLSGQIASAGIFSSLPLAQQGVTGLGIGEAGDLLGIGADQTDTWSGQTIDGSTVLIKYTYVGDANLDGAIDGGDYGIIDNFAQVPGATGYFNGDFNLDGAIDGGDYGIIDNNIQAQGGPL